LQRPWLPRSEAERQKRGSISSAPGNVAGAMADAIETALEEPATAQVRAKSLRERIFLHFSQKAMVEGVLAGHRDAFADR